MSKPVIWASTLLAAVFTATAGAWDSTRWEGSYEAKDMPNAESGFAWGGWGPGASIANYRVSGGILHGNTIGTESGSQWEQWTDLSPSYDFSPGASVEIRAKLNSWEGAGAFNFSFYDRNDRGAVFEIGASYLSFPNSDWIAFNTMDDFHIYTIAFHTDGANLLADLFVDKGTTPLLTVIESTIYSGRGVANTMQFGDGTDTNDASFDIDYIRWTDAGAVPEPTVMGPILIGLGVLRLLRYHSNK